MRTNFLGQTDRQTDGQTEKFNTISRRYKGDNLGSKVKDDSQVVRLRSGSH